MTFVSLFPRVPLPRFAEQTIRPAMNVGEETPADVFAREALLDAAFGRGRFLKTCERLREGRFPAEGLALAMKDGESLVGSVRLWNIDAGGVEALLLGPLAVDAAYRSRGLGRALMEEGLSRAAAFGHRAVLLVGDAPYYDAFGFSHEHTRGLELPGPVDEARFLGLELVTGSLDGARGPVTATGVFEPRRPLAA